MANYSALDKLLHHMALQFSFVGEMSFDLEQSSLGKDRNDITQARHVFVAGLARAGTTVLMRSLFETGQFASLTYRDMPFVLAPNLWAKLSGLARTDMAKQERAHGDGVMVDLDSPEALEEVFWRVFSGDQYLSDAGLKPYVPNAQAQEKFRQYVYAILTRYQGHRYLSKNNNNILRLGSLVRMFPKAIILVPFRDPLQHAFSLLKQHRRFIKEQQQDPFTERYMTWLAHHEFGQAHRPFLWPDVGEPVNANRDSLDYWLEQWINAHQSLLARYSELAGHMRFVGYELICEQTDEVWAHLTDQLGVPLGETPDLRVRRAQTPPLQSPGLLTRAEHLYQRLNQLSRADLLGPIQG